MAARGDLRVTEQAKVIESHTEVIEEGSSNRNFRQ